jgi:hypothetical protein
MYAKEPWFQYIVKSSTIAEFSWEGMISMPKSTCDLKRCLIVAILGALGGGLAVVLATKALPEIMSELGPKMMQKMMGQMGEDGCDPAEM